MMRLIVFEDVDSRGARKPPRNSLGNSPLGSICMPRPTDTVTPRCSAEPLGLPTSYSSEALERGMFRQFRVIF